MIESVRDSMGNWCAEAERRVRRVYGFMPNLLGMIVSSPALGKAHSDALTALRQGSLTVAEQEVVMLTVATWHDASYCAALHRMIAVSAGVAQAETDRVMCGELPRAPRLRALVACSRVLIEARGLINRQQRQAFNRQGIESRQILEIIGLISLATTEVLVDGVRSPELDKEIAALAVKQLHTPSG